MTDRKLLELAAKAAGIVLVWVDCCDEDGFPTGMATRDFCYVPSAKPPHNRRSSDDMQGEVWNPLTEDGDALRLAVKLGIHVSKMTAQYWDEEGLEHKFENDADEPMADTRRAIVRAAAEMGEAMP